MGMKVINEPGTSPFIILRPACDAIVRKGIQNLLHDRPYQSSRLINSISTTTSMIPWYRFIYQ